MTPRPLLPFGATDRAMAVADTMSPVTFQVVLHLTGEVNGRRLSDAWSGLAQRHPILTATVDPAADRSWVTGTHPLAPPTYFAAVDQHEARALVHQTITKRCDVQGGHVVSLDAISTPGAAWIVLSAHHAAIDGRAAFLLLDDLRTMYCSNEGLPEDRAPRSAAEAMASAPLPIATRERIVARSRRRWRRLLASEHTDPAAVVPGAPSLGFATMDISDALADLTDERRRRGWHFDAVLIGLLSAAWADVFGDQGASGWLLAADVRRDVGETRGMGNLSGAEPVVVREVERSTGEVIDQAQREVAALRTGYPGLAPEILASVVRRVPVPLLNRGIVWAWGRARALRYSRVVSNLGVIDPALGDWETARLERISFVPPLAHPPYTVFMVSTLGDQTTMTVRTSQEWLTETHVLRLESALRQRAASLRPAHPPVLDASD